ncbi:nitroreductase family deazaflavin-dependent oxidoreductase [Nocardiopsis trehalosi]|uniref:nitroreductase family deazaflavin-dependent oxidoreductase n=1 Tax=Nocardiopsis trehalosi TaxID=109329 RepID=UPI00082C0CD6|nr:nitroreductase family deazaflavin-dependent oxidoreductase [Nocardiopsis trehalosi]
MRFPNPARTGLSRALVRAPILVYRVGLGALLGHRMVLLTHVGRTSGLPRQVVLEVVDRDPATGTVVIASGYGARAQWFRNVVARPRVRFQVGRHRYEGTCRPLPPEESGRRLADYARRHPLAAATLMRGLGHTAATDADVRRLGADRENGVPLLELRPDT